MNQHHKQTEHPLVRKLLTPEFIGQFKDSRELNLFMEQFYAQAIEQMLEREIMGDPVAVLGGTIDEPDNRNCA